MLISAISASTVAPNVKVNPCTKVSSKCENTVDTSFNSTQPTQKKSQDKKLSDNITTGGDIAGLEGLEDIFFNPEGYKFSVMINGTVTEHASELLASEKMRSTATICSRKSPFPQA